MKTQQVKDLSLKGIATAAEAEKSSLIAKLVDSMSEKNKEFWKSLKVDKFIDRSRKDVQRQIELIEDEIEIIEGRIIDKLERFGNNGKIDEDNRGQFHESILSLEADIEVKQRQIKRWKEYGSKYLALAA